MHESSWPVRTCCEFALDPPHSATFVRSGSPGAEFQSPPEPRSRLAIGPSGDSSKGGRCCARSLGCLHARHCSALASTDSHKLILQLCPDALAFRRCGRGPPRPRLVPRLGERRDVAVPRRRQLLPVGLNLEHVQVAGLGSAYGQPVPKSGRRLALARAVLHFVRRSCPHSRSRRKLEALTCTTRCAQLAGSDGQLAEHDAAAVPRRRRELLVRRRGSEESRRARRVAFYRLEERGRAARAAGRRGPRRLLRGASTFRRLDRLSLVKLS